MKSSSSVFLLSLLTLSSLAFAEGTALPNLKGTVRIGECSAALVAPEGYLPSDNAWILTNGHCIEMGSLYGQYPAPAEVLYKVPPSTIKLAKLFSENSWYALNVSELTYATMTDTDIGIYTTNETYQKIHDEAHVDPFILAKDVRNTLSIGAKIQLTSAYWKNSSSCNYEMKIDKIREGDWEWGPSLRLSQECKIDHGSSGSPLIFEGTNYIVGIINSMYEGGEACTFNNPCEIDSTGKITTTKKNQPYGQFVDGIYSCLDSQRKIDLSLSGCTLPKPKQ